MEALTHIDAEKTVLGCVLSDSESTYRVLPLLKATDFSIDSRRRIYHAITELAEAGKPVDELTLTDALISKGQLESIGGVGYVASLSYNVDIETSTGDECRALRKPDYRQITQPPGTCSG
jgi:replicative DNA helicase